MHVYSAHDFNLVLYRFPWSVCWKFYGTFMYLLKSALISHFVRKVIFYVDISFNIFIKITLRNLISRLFVTKYPGILWKKYFGLKFHNFFSKWNPDRHPGCQDSISKNLKCYSVKGSGSHVYQYPYFVIYYWAADLKI